MDHSYSKGKNSNAPLLKEGNDNNFALQQQISMTTSGDLGGLHSYSQSSNACVLPVVTEKIDDLMRVPEGIIFASKGNDIINQQEQLSSDSQECRSTAALFSEVILLEPDKEEIIQTVEDLTTRSDVAPKRIRRPTKKIAEFLCRLCGQQSCMLIKIFGARGKQLQLAEKIHFHLPIIVTETDKLPLSICVDCIKALTVCDDLYKNSFSTDGRLREILLKEDVKQSPSIHPTNKQNLKHWEESRKSDSGTVTSVEAGEETGATAADVSEGVGLECTQAKTDSVTRTASQDSYSDVSGENSQEDPENFEHEVEEQELVENDKLKNDAARKTKKKAQKTEEACDLCDKVFLGHVELSKHRKTHSAEERLKCRDCGKVMPNDSSFTSHRRTHTDNVHPCELCGKILASKSGRAAHMLVHDVPKFCCQVCGKTMRTLSKVQLHMAMHSEERPFSCTTCGQAFKTRATLRQHGTVHSDAPKFVCEICAHACHRRSHLHLHTRIHHGVNSNRTHKYRCHKCHMTFGLYADLLRHKKSAHCVEVKSSATSSISLEKKCHKCNRHFSSANYLLRHERICAQKCLECEHCGRSFSSTRTLQYHLRCHSGEQPFVCRYCDKAFRGPESMKSHEMSHTGERPYKCPFCSKSFRSVTTLYQHKLVHAVDKKYKCNMCDYKSARPSALRIHLRVHTGEKPYKCSQCSKAYKQSWDLKLHMKVHE